MRGILWECVRIVGAGLYGNAWARQLRTCECVDARHVDWH